MKFDSSQLLHYTENLNKSLVAVDEARRSVAYHRLQIKQTKAKLAAAKKDAMLKAFIARMPEGRVEVMPAPDRVYASVRLSAVEEYALCGVPDHLGLRMVESKSIHGGHGSPWLSTYRHGFVDYYITKEVF